MVYLFLILRGGENKKALRRIRLPFEYQEVEWIGFNGQYINTFMPWKASNIELKILNTHEITTSAFLCGKNATVLSGRRMIYLTSSSIVVQNGAQNRFQKSFQDGLNTISIIDLSIFINGIELYFQNLVLATTNEPYIIGGAFTDVTAESDKIDSRMFKGRVVFAKVYNSIHSLVLIPCYRKSDGVIGMYDLCGSICPLTETPFYINSGTGEFTKGPDVN